MFAGRVAQDHRVGLEVHGDVAHVDLVFARLQIEGKFLANHSEVLVVDGERWWRGLLRIEAAAQGQKTDEASVHEGNPPGAGLSNADFNSTQATFVRTSELVTLAGPGAAEPSGARPPEMTVLAVMIQGDHYWVVIPDRI